MEQQTATSEVLKVISSSPGELEPVFEAMLVNAVRICGAKFGNLFLREGDGLRAVAFHGAPQAYVEERRRNPVLHPNPATTLGRAMATKQPVQIADIQAYEPDTIDAASGTTGVKLAKLAGARTVLAVPMVKESELVGVVVIYRQEVLPFTDKQIDLVQNFGAQAVIAVENTRLLNELRQRTGDLSEALEQQTATSEVLRVISSSPNDLRPVFHSMLENSVRICEAKFGQMFLCEGENVRAVAHLDVPAALVEWDEQRGTFRPSAEGGLMRAMRTKNVIHIDDFMSEQPSNPVVKLGGARSYIAVPMLKENELVGVIVIYRQEVRPFTEKQIDLVRNFATQAVIAIENARLLNELRESLEQQTATSEVLKVISSSPGELELVFNAMLANATRICEAKYGNLFLREGNIFRAVAVHSKEGHVDLRRNPVLDLRDNPGTPIDRVATTKQVVHIPDLRTDQSYIGKNDRIVPLVEVGGARTFATVPMLKEGELIGAISLYRQEVRPFTEKQIELVQNFAAQAVIAIENTRLLNELRESLQQQTATADVLKVISSSPGDLEPVFNAMLENAVRICQAKFGAMHRFVGEEFYAVAQMNLPQALDEFLRQRGQAKAIPGSDMDNLYKSKQVVHTTDMLATPVPSPPARLAGARTQLAVPMLMEGELIGAIVIYRQEVLPFTDKQIELVQNFAAQAVIAIENTRLLNDLRESLQQQTATSDVLKVISSSLNDLKPVFETIGQRAEKLCDAEISVISMVDGDHIRLVSINGVTEEGVEAVRRVYPMRRDDETVTARTIRSAAICHVPDVLADALYQTKDAARVSGFRGCLGVPMIRDGQVVGAIFVARRQPGLFADSQVQLLKTFADQAVIAIENVRLFNETKNPLPSRPPLPMC